MDQEHPTIEYEGRTFTLSYVELIPRHTDEELESLKLSIQQFGILDPVKHTPDDVIVDGATRLILAHNLGIPLSQVPMKEVSSETADDLAVQLAFAHRAGTRERRVILAHRLRQLGWSLRRIAKALGVSHESVARYHSEPVGDSGVTNVTPERVQGADGKTYAATQPESGDGNDGEDGESQPDVVVDTTDSPLASNHPTEDKPDPTPKPKSPPKPLTEEVVNKKFRAAFTVAFDMFKAKGEFLVKQDKKSCYPMRLKEPAKTTRDCWQAIMDAFVGVDD